MMDEDNFDVWPEPEEQPSLWRNCLRMLLALLLVVVLLGGSLVGVIWAVRVELEKRPFADTQNPMIPTLAANSRVTAVAPPTPESLNRIVYVTRDGRIATISPNGENGRILSQTQRNYLFPAWSPTEVTIAVIGNSAAGATVVQLQDQAQSQEQLIYTSRQQPAIYLYWSPDGRYLSFIASDVEDGLKLHISVPEQATESRVLAGGQPFYWQWTADSQQLFIHSGFTGRNARLTLLDAAGTGEGENIASPGFFQSPAISADGRYWAYAEEGAINSSWLVVADTQSGELQRERHGGHIALGWSPAANQLAYISGNEQDGRFFGPLRLFDTATGQTTLLSRGVVLAFFWSPDGRYLAYFTLGQANGNEFQAMNRQQLGKQAQQIEHLLHLSVVDVSTGQGLLLAEFTPTLIFLSQFLPFFDQYALSHRLWSPDSTALVLPMRVAGESRIFVVPVSGNQPQDIVAGDMAFWSHR